MILACAPNFFGFGFRGTREEFRRAFVRRGIAQVAAEALSVNLRFGNAQGFFDGGFVCAVEHGFCKFGRFGFFFVAVETVGGIAERNRKRFGNGCCLRFFKGMNVHIDRFLILRPFGGFGCGFVQRGAVGFSEAGDGNGLQTVVRRDFGVGRNFDLLQGKRRGEEQSGCSVAMLRRRQIIATPAC